MGSPIGYYPKSEIALRFGRVGMVRFDSVASRGDGVRQYWVLGRDLVDKGPFFGMFGYVTYFIYATSSGSFYNTETESSLGVDTMVLFQLVMEIIQIQNPVEEAVWRKVRINIKAASSSPKRRKALKRVDEGDLEKSYASNQTLEHYMSNPIGQAVLFVNDISYADHYSFHDNVRWDAWGRFAETCTAYQSWIWTASNQEIDFAPEIGEYKHRYHVPYRASGNTLSGLNLSHPLIDQQLASGSSLGHSFQQAKDALTRNGKTSADFDPLCY
ncbi:hypothetical protein OROHE_020553 [Orobanche hederae]